MNSLLALSFVKIKRPMTNPEMLQLLHLPVALIMAVLA
jgi:hypothetical protein